MRVHTCQASLLLSSSSPALIPDGKASWTATSSLLHSDMDELEVAEAMRLGGVDGSGVLEVEFLWRCLKDSMAHWHAMPLQDVFTVHWALEVRLAQQGLGLSPVNRFPSPNHGSFVSRRRLGSRNKRVRYKTAC
jgi:hypothetical protein